MLKFYSLFFAFFLISASVSYPSREWTLQLSSISFEAPGSKATNSNGNVFLASNFSGEIDVDPTSNMETLTSNGLADVVVVKIASNGTYEWAKQIGGSDFDNGDGLAVSPNDQISALGLFRSTVDFDPNEDINNLTEIGGADPFFLQSDSDGNFIEVNSFGSPSFEYCETIFIDETGQQYHGGVFRNTVDIDPSTETYSITSQGSTDLFLRKLNAVIIGCPGDANDDLIVNILDLVAVSSNFGCNGTCLGDVNNDMMVNILDLVEVSSFFGNDCQ